MDPNLPPDLFLYGRLGPWPQPSPAHPLVEAWEVLNVPAVEQMLWQGTIGQRYFETMMAYPPVAAKQAVDIKDDYVGPDDQRFASIMFTTAFQQYLQPLDPADVAYLQSKGLDPTKAGVGTKYDFGAMALVQPLAGLYCAPTRVYISGSTISGQKVAAISVGDVLVVPKDAAWGLAKIYALQGAAYHILFVQHPALHFPMDSVNAITKTAVPMAHPLFQLIYPHTTYTLALDNAVLEGAQSVVNNDAQGTWFDPLTGEAYNLKLLFAAGYTGLSDPQYRNAYPAYRYLEPPLVCLPTTTKRPVHSTAYSIWQSAYVNRAFLPFCTGVAKAILAVDNGPNGYVARWANYLSQTVLGFPDGKEILDADCLGLTLAIYLWDVTLAHGADHASFGVTIAPEEKFLRIRAAPPTSASSASPTRIEQIATRDDLARQAIANQMFFRPWTMAPNLNDTQYAFTDPTLSQLQDTFHDNLSDVDKDANLTRFMPLTPATAADYSGTIPATIQY